jgi:hypothetical protein
MTGVAGKAAPTPPSTGASVPPAPPAKGSTGIGIGAVPISGAAPARPSTLPPIVVKPPPPPTSPPVPNDFADAGVPPSYVFGGTYGDGRVVAAFWDGAREPAVLVDPKTGEGTVVGYLGNLHWWESQLVYDGKTNLLYALGSDVNDVRYVYTLALETHSVRTVHQAAPPQTGGAQSYLTGGVTSVGLLVVAYWTNAVWMVALLDPATGEAKDVGALSDAYSIQYDRLAYDDAKRMVYLLGADKVGTQQVYSFALDTGKAQAATIEESDNRSNIVLGQATPKGEVVVAYWNDPAQREEIGLMDPLTGKITMAGVLKGLHLWSDQITYGSTSGRVVAYGMPAESAPWQFYDTTIRQ